MKNNPMQTTTTIAYKPDHDDYCRSCLMNSFSSEFEIITTSTEEELIQKLAKLNAELPPEDCDYEFYFLINGYIAGEGQIHPDAADDEIFQQIMDKVSHLNHEIHQAVQVEIQLKKTEQLRKKQEEIERNRIATQNRELETLKRLKEKYPDQSS